MFFSKIFYPVAVVLSVAATAFASPVAAPVAAELVNRQTDTLLADLQAFQIQVAPVISSFSGTSDDVNALASLSAVITAKIEGDVFVSADVDLVLDVAVEVVVDLVAQLNLFLDLNIELSAQIDFFLSCFINALDAKHPGYGQSIGAAIPVLDLDVLVVLDLALSAKDLVLIDILGIIVL